MKTYITGALAAAAMLVSGAAQAEESFVTGWYLELQAGAVFGDKPDVTTTGIGNDDYDPDDVFTLVAAVGKNITDNIRAEFQFSWTNSEDGDYVNLPHSGNTDVYGFMLNGIYSFDLGGPVSPYVGAGVGIAVYDVDNLGAVGGAFVVNDTETVFQGVGILGVDYHFNDWIAATARLTAGWSDGASFDTTAPGVRSKMDDRFIYGVTGGIRLTAN